MNTYIFKTDFTNTDVCEKTNVAQNATHTHTHRYKYDNSMIYIHQLMLIYSVQLTRSPSPKPATGLASSSLELRSFGKSSTLSIGHGNWLKSQSMQVKLFLFNYFLMNNIIL